MRTCLWACFGCRCSQCYIFIAMIREHSSASLPNHTHDRLFSKSQPGLVPQIMDNGGKTRMCDGGIATVLRILYRMKLRSLEMVARQIVTSTLNHYLAAEA